jgi:hypothetical protein
MNSCWQLHNISVYIKKMWPLYNGDLAPIYRSIRVVMLECHDHVYPMTVAVSSLLEVAMGGFLLPLRWLWWQEVVTSMSNGGSLAASSWG